MYIFVLFSQLDLSYNRLRKIEGLENLTNLRKLFLVNNKISKIEKINHLTKLEMLELGANRIRVSTIFCLLFTEVQVFGSVTFVCLFVLFLFFFFFLSEIRATGIQILWFILDTPKSCGYFSKSVWVQFDVDSEISNF